ncbi:glutaredoxin family protein [Suttonella ornithocola]|uniref:Glutaredoxin-like domain (DUF836) n=1 Tax=Suttonella ornithocola TaxID=279832 RepID=A0A380MS86_9GAMM|nr:glutaredoxin family protein [Suttonella ornithocola]SUO95034.1 Glutaredoxin-like domain (DUF836) [Suttonella ornithocola]
MKLLVRLGCHLCEDAAQLLLHLGVSFERVDVDREIDLQKEYGQLVPVLYDQEAERELLYPFDAEAVLDFISDERFLKRK